MKRANFKTMPVDELLMLRDEITRVLSSRVERERRELEGRLAKLRTVKLADNNEKSIRGRAKRKKSGKIPPKYRNPANPGETWAGRGRQPLWMTAQIKAGKKPADFLIGSKRGTARRGRPRPRRKAA